MEQGLYLIIPEEMPENQVVEKLKAFYKTDVPQAVLYSPASFGKEAQKIVSFFQSKDIAVIIRDNVEQALSLNADGVHVSYGAGIKKIRKQIGDLSLGILCATRDEAMRAGDAGADYIAFKGQKSSELCQWWSELFTLPCVDFNPDHPSEFADFRVRILS